MWNHDHLNLQETGLSHRKRQGFYPSESQRREQLTGEAALDPHWDKIGCDEKWKEKKREGGKVKGGKDGRKKGRERKNGGIREEGKEDRRAGGPAEHQPPCWRGSRTVRRDLEELSVWPVGETDMNTNHCNSRQQKATALSCFISEGWRPKKTFPRSKLSEWLSVGWGIFSSFLGEEGERGERVRRKDEEGRGREKEETTVIDNL